MSRYTKLEFPRFNGDGLTEWLYKAEQFFEIDHTLEAAKVKLASIHLAGKSFALVQSFLENTRKRQDVLVGGI